MLIDVVAGARPNFMKISPIIKALKRKGRSNKNISYRLVHTGQHYDQKMSSAFFEQLNIPKPDINLEVRSGTQAEQTSAIMLNYEALLQKGKPDLCLVVGDVNSTMACAIVAQKQGVSVAHIEAGLRSNDWSMPEEINRLVTDSISNLFFTTSSSASENLLKSGVEREKIFFVGNTMIDTLLENLGSLKVPSFWNQKSLISGNYFVLTLHRPANVDKVENLTDALREIVRAARGLPIIFPVHPRTSNVLKEINDLPKNLVFVPPQPYLEFIYLVKNSKAVVTDSGGITEETTVLGIPCMTLRSNTERPETVTLGTNELLGIDPMFIKPAFDKLFSNQWKTGCVPPKWDGQASERIVEVLLGLSKV